MISMTGGTPQISETMAFLLSLGKCLSLVVCMVFVEGIIASRPNTEKVSLILPWVMTIVTIGVTIIWMEWVYSVCVLVPTLLCWFIWYICRRSVKNGTALTLKEDDLS